MPWRHGLPAAWRVGALSVARRQRGFFQRTLRGRAVVSLPRHAGRWRGEDGEHSDHPGTLPAWRQPSLFSLSRSWLRTACVQAVSRAGPVPVPAVQRARLRKQALRRASLAAGVPARGQVAAAPWRHRERRARQTRGHAGGRLRTPAGGDAASRDPGTEAGTARLLQLVERLDRRRRMQFTL